jgi:hypothetical protein
MMMPGLNFSPPQEEDDKVLEDHGQEANHVQEEQVQIQDARPKYESVSASLTLSFWIEKWQ